MQGDLLLQEWKQAKQTCKKIIEICKSMHLGKGNVEGKVLAPGERQTNKQFINVYDVVYRLCLTNDKEQNRVLMVYRDYKQLLKTALLEMAPLLNQEKDVYRLLILHKIWETYCEMQKRLNNMFAYLNRPYHLKNDKIQDLNRTSTNIISGTLFGQISVAEYEAIYFQEIDRIRKTKDMTNSKMLANLVSIFYQIHSKMLKYISNKKARTIFTQFYSHYQQKARQYYIRQFKVLKQISPSEYFPQVHLLFQQESEIAQNCFVITADTLINKQFADQLIINYKQILLTSQYGLKYILRQGQTQTLKLIVDINLKLTKSLDGFKEQFEEFILEQMKNFIEQNKLELTLKRNVINYCSFMQKLIRKNEELLTILEATTHVGDFVTYYKNGIEQAFLRTKMAVPVQQLLAIYSDLQLRKQMNEQQIQRQVKNILTIFNCIHNKDLFMIKYSQRFAKRILVLNQISLNNHQIFVNNLKLNCGIKYTQMIETILTQYRISRDFEPQLNEINQEQKLPIGLTLKMFSQGAWPTQAVLQLPVEFFPPQLQNAQNCIDSYRNLYLNKKTLKVSGLQSKVRWVYFFDPQVKNKSQTCYFDTNTLQAILLFYLYKNRPNKVPLNFFAELLSKINVNLIKQNLNKMSDVTQNLLIKQKQLDCDVYQFNTMLKSTKKLISYEQGNSQQEEKLFQTHDLSKDREIVLDANLSKIMKAKKILDFKTLVQQVVKMIKVFTPQTKDIKLAIDRLITKQIIQRDEKDRQQLRYKD